MGGNAFVVFVYRLGLRCKFTCKYPGASLTYRDFFSVQVSYFTRKPYKTCVIPIA